MQLANSTVFITGANRGIGLAFARAALQRGARKVYAGARDPDSVTLAGVIPVRLDVNNPDSVAAAARKAGDAQIVINNAGIAQFGGFLAPNGLQSAHAQMETNFFGPLRIAQAFAPILQANGGGALLNVLSVASWISRPQLAVYAASKTAAWSLTNGLRNELRPHGTQVLGLHMGFVDTDLTTGIDAPKSNADDIVRAALDALEAGAEEVLADEITRQVKRGLSGEPGVYLAAP
ncbi:SDR family oxidoreductase [Ramlibacter sp. XY19]|uniref:SDR family oxidoreductase n=1 Tax=Ramlibacter paludis TaxID=2908000 RepID=UPI0023DB4A1B|nr:SDR family oxidoreductase [Ramlibacter paludis]MCG2594331.1 SDR family oxidoreductase [Ramlibacter paludis]